MALRERAVELAALVLGHEDSLPETRGAAQELADKPRVELAPGLYAAAEERGRARNLHATVEELQAELGVEATRADPTSDKPREGGSGA